MKTGQVWNVTKRQARDLWPISNWKAWPALRSTGFISRSGEEVGAFFFLEDAADASDSFPELVMGSGGCLSDQGFDLGECHFDRVDIKGYGGRNKNLARMFFRISAAFGLRWVAGLSTIIIYHIPEGSMAVS